MNALEIKGLCKHYPSFSLKDVSFNVPKGSITGFIGRNGAGKTTTLKSIMNIIHYEKGTIKVFGKDMLSDELNLKQDIAFSLSEINYYPNVKLRKISKVTAKFFNNFNYDTFNKLCKQFSLDLNKKIEELSSGMKVKYSLAIALSHDAKLLILDEPTSGLDPVSRDEILDIFLSLAKKGISVLFSTHITSDLDRCADYIAYINKGKIIYSGKTDELTKGYSIVRGEMEDLSKDIKNKLLSYREQFGQFIGLINSKTKIKSKKIKVIPASIEDVMLYIEKGDNHEETII